MLAGSAVFEREEIAVEKAKSDVKDYSMRTETPVNARAAKYRPYIIALEAWKGLDKPLRNTAVDLILWMGEWRAAPANKTWCKAGWEADNMGYILLKGRVEVVRDGIGRRICHAPYLLGEMLQFHPKQVRTATITSVEDCLVLQFSWDDFWKAIAARCDKDESAALQKAVERYAQEHFRGMP